jgi:hypothetical protein
MLRLEVRDKTVVFIDEESNYESAAIPRKKFLGVMDRLLSEFEDVEDLQEITLPILPEEGN